MDSRKEILDSIQILINKAMENVTKIYVGRVISVSGDRCTISINGRDYSIQYYGGEPVVGTTYRVFAPDNNISVAFIIVPK